MKKLRHTLVSEGPSDANLIPIIDWTLREAGGVSVSQGVRADFWRLPKRPPSLAERLICAVDVFPCDVLFIHRDADRETPMKRVDEIRNAFQIAVQRGVNLPAVAVIPVRMLEAWFFFDERSIRHAAGNPNGRVALSLPSPNRAETCANPKKVLSDALLTASELSGRRRKKFDLPRAFRLISDYTEGFSPLRLLPAYRAFEKSIRSLKDSNWKAGIYG